MEDSGEAPEAADAVPEFAGRAIDRRSRSPDFAGADEPMNPDDPVEMMAVGNDGENGGENVSGRKRRSIPEEDVKLEVSGGEGDDPERGVLDEDRVEECPCTPTLEPLDPPSSNITPVSERNMEEFPNGGYDDEEEDDEEDDEDEEDDDSEAKGPPFCKKQKTLATITDQADSPSQAKNSENLTPPAIPSTSKKSKKKNSNSRRKSSSRKSKKKGKSLNSNNLAPPEDKVLIAPIPRLSDKCDDTPDAIISLSKVYKAEKVELSEDRLTAGSTKGYRMVRATRGVIEGTWYFEINVLRLGETGHTRLGWTTEKGDLQAPVGYDSNSYGYRDIDGAKIHKALREKYGDEGYVEGDVIGFYINLPDGETYAPKPPQLVWYKGQRYVYASDPKDDPPKVIPGSEIVFFKNGKCQGTAFADIFGGRYYPAASMYTLPNQPNCEVRFNFGPEFQFFPEDFGGRPIPRPMIEAPYHGYVNKEEGPAENGTAEKEANGVSS